MAARGLDELIPRVDARLLRRPDCLLAFGFGVGLIGPAPGTLGTLLAIPLYLLLAPLPVAGYVAVLIGLFALGVPLCWAASRAVGAADHPSIVFDEIVGYLIAMLPACGGLGEALLGAVLFRVFDIWKPWPVRWVDHHVRGGVGIMLDDAVAGGYAALALAGWLYFAGC